VWSNGRKSLQERNFFMKDTFNWTSAAEAIFL